MLQNSIHVGCLLIYLSLLADVFSVEGLSEKEIYDLSLRELFVSQTFEIVHANRIRGKCNVILMEDVVDENLVDLIKENATFFYHLSYDPVKRSIKSDKGYIRVGSEFQATIPNLIGEYQFSFLFTPMLNLSNIQWGRLFLLSNRSFLLYLYIFRSFS